MAGPALRHFKPFGFPPPPRGKRKDLEEPQGRRAGPALQIPDGGIKPPLQQKQIPRCTRNDTQCGVARPPAPGGRGLESLLGSCSHGLRRGLKSIGPPGLGK